MIQHAACDKYCVFISDASWYALPALAVREVTPCPILFRVPATDNWLAGICHLRNEFLAVVRLDLLHRRDSGAKPCPQQLLVVSGTARVWGLLVDEVVALESLESSVRADLDRDDGYFDFQMGAATYREQFVRLLDPHQLYGYAEHRQREAELSFPESVPGVPAAELAGGGLGDRT
jgi:chemotaxis signal transduction protein